MENSCMIILFDCWSTEILRANDRWFVNNESNNPTKAKEFL